MPSSRSLFAPPAPRDSHRDSPTSSRRHTRHARRPLRFAGLALPAVALVLAGCGTSASADSEAASPTESSETTATGFPVTVDNCGTEVTFDSAPERVLTVKSSTLELMLALGLGDRIIGSAFSDGPVPEEFAAAASGIETISDKVPSQEVALELEPDLVYAGWESNFSADGVGDRDQLEQLGVHTYVAPAACKAAGYMPDPLTFNEVFAEFTEVGEIFGVPDVAAGLVAGQQAELDAIEPNTEGLSALWYSSGSDTPYVGAGIGAPQMIMGAAGLDNIGADVHDTWTSMSWEAIADANPEVIVLVDAAWNTADSKIELLETNPVTAALPAVQEQRYVVLDFASTEAGVRNVGAVQTTVDQLEALGL